MRISVDLQERFGRDARIVFEDHDLERECSAQQSSRLHYDLTTLVGAFGGLLVGAVEDHLAATSDRHRIIEEVTDLIEHYAAQKLTEASNQKS